MSSSPLENRPSRIPAALQSVFLASNRGKVVHKPPPQGLANKTFVPAGLHRDKDGSGSSSTRRWRWLRLFGRFRKKSKKKSGTPNNSDEPAAARADPPRGGDHTESTTGSDHDVATMAAATSTTTSLVEASPTRALPASPSAPVTKAPPPSSRCFYQSKTPTKPTTATNTTPRDSGVIPLEIQFENPDLANADDASTTGEETHPAAAQVESAPDTRCEGASPQQFLDKMLQSRGYSTARFPSLQTAYFNPPTSLQKASYGTYLVDAVREEETKRVNDMLAAGLSPNPSNAHGESLMHLVARYGNVTMLQLLLDHGATVQCVDDYGRSPLHDACWSNHPSWRVVDVLLRQDPRLLSLTDSRGATPLSYVPRTLWKAWQSYLAHQVDAYWPARDLDRDGTQPFPPLVLQKPGSRPLPNPSQLTLPVKVAKLLAQGRLTPKEVRWLVVDDDDDVDNSIDQEDDCETESDEEESASLSSSEEDDYSSSEEDDESYQEKEDGSNSEYFSLCSR